MDLIAYVASVASPDHAVNQDSIVCAVEDGLFAVFDGVGGHAGGELASGLAAEAFEIRRRFLPEARKSRQGLKLWLRETMAFAHERIQKKANVETWLTGMATTACAVLVHEDMLVTANVGDSRARQLERGLLYRLTEDHGIMDQIAMLAGYSPQDAAIIEQITSRKQAVGKIRNIFKSRNTITKALGVGTFPEPDIREHSFPDTAINLVYTDGVGDNLIERMPSGVDTYTLRFRSLDQMIMLYGASQECVDNIVAEAIKVYSQSDCVRQKPDDATVIVFSRA